MNQIQSTNISYSNQQKPTTNDQNLDQKTTTSGTQSSNVASTNDNQFQQSSVQPPTPSVNVELSLSAQELNKGLNAYPSSDKSGSNGTVSSATGSSEQAATTSENQSNQTAIYEKVEATTEQMEQKQAPGNLLSTLV